MLRGRPQDVLSCVLVDPALAGNPDFCYPPPRREMLRGSDGRLRDARRGHIELAEIPFVGQKTHGCARPKRAIWGECCNCYFSAGNDFPLETVDQLAGLYHAAGGRAAGRLAASLRGADAPDHLRQLKSKTNHAIIRVLGGRLPAAPYLIRGLGRYRKRHGIPLDKDLIDLRE